jgi:phosphoglycolate phosphatase
MKRTVHRHTPRGELKPNPEILKAILRDIGASPEESIYVGDSLMKDVAMAQEAGVTDVYAKYGDRRGSAQYDLLREVTHWPAEEVEQEKKFQTEGELVPSYVLKHSLQELLDLFDFAPRKR